MLTIFSMAEARYFPVTLQDRGDRDGSLGDPMEVPPSSDEPLLRGGNRMNTSESCLAKPRRPG